MIRFIYYLSEFLFPRKCVLCRDFLQKDETDLCRKCRTSAPEYPFGALNPMPARKNKLHFLDSFTAIWYYENDIRKSIHRFKFNRAIHYAPQYARLLAMRIMEQGPQQYDELTWVPVSRSRRRQRGYDQCKLLARYVGKELGITPKALLVKTRNSPPQSGIESDSRRKANVLGAFEVVKNADVKGRSILLLDDVYTTGATTEECARVLLSAGAREVHCAAIAAVRTRNKNKVGD